MKRYSLSHLSNPALLRDLAALVARERATTAALLAHIAEVDARKLYLPAAYPSMFAYCVGELRLCEQAAFKRILAARTARRFPALFDALAEGRLHLSAVVLLAPHLTEDSADELLAAATHRSKSEIEQFLAERFPRPELPARVEAIPASMLTPSPGELAPGPVEDQLSPGIVAPRHGGDRPRVKPLAAQSFAVQFTMSQSTHDKLRYAQELLGHQLPCGDIAAVLERALDALISQLERRKFASTARPHPRPGRASANPRYVPAHVRRTVWGRDGGRCTFVSQTGRRCESRKFLEYDHIDEVARGGEATVDRIRLRCRAHNQFTAERTFGAEFMRHKRQAAAAARAAAKAHATAKARARAAADEQSQERDVVPWLRQLGFRADEAHHAAAGCETIPDAPLEERVRLALSLLGPPCRRVEYHQVAAT